MDGFSVSPLGSKAQSKWRGAVDRSTTMCQQRGASWESKWQAMEADLMEAASDELAISKPSLPITLSGTVPYDVSEPLEAGPGLQTNAGQTSSEESDGEELSQSRETLNNCAAVVGLSGLSRRHRRQLNPDPRITTIPHGECSDDEQSFGLLPYRSADHHEEVAEPSCPSHPSSPSASPRSSSSASRSNADCRDGRCDSSSPASVDIDTGLYASEGIKGDESPAAMQRYGICDADMWAEDTDFARTFTVDQMLQDPSEASAEVVCKDAGNDTADAASSTVEFNKDATIGAIVNLRERRVALPPRDVAWLWRLWRTLVVLSLLEATLIVGVTLLDQIWSPCREPLSQCYNLHVDDCKGSSCQESIAFWTPLWPVAGLFCLAMPLRLVLRGTSPRISVFVMVASLAVVGMGAMVLAELIIRCLQYVARCPMDRAEGRCTADLCPLPPCRRESAYSPCICGRLGEAEMARALFLNNLPACQPYEWYTWQMNTLETLLLKYENFACAVGALSCTSAILGGVLLLVQLACCPLLFLGHCGLDRALLVLFASNDELDRLIVREIQGPVHPGRRFPSTAELDAEVGDEQTQQF